MEAPPSFPATHIVRGSVPRPHPPELHPSILQEVPHHTQKETESNPDNPAGSKH